MVRRVANKFETSWQRVAVMEFGKRHNTTDTTDFCPRQLFTDLLRICHREATAGKIRETVVMDFGFNGERWSDEREKVRTDSADGSMR